MELTLENFFNHLIFYPSDAKTEKEQAIAWVATIACGIFSLGACHAICALRNYCFTHIPPEKATDQHRKISKKIDQALKKQPSKIDDAQLIKAITAPTNVKTTYINRNLFTDSPIIAPSNIEVKIPPEVKITLDKLFENSPYSIDNLPIYPTVVIEIDREKMTAPVMKGLIEDGRPFIAIKLDCDLRDEDIEKTTPLLKDQYSKNRQLNKTLILFQYSTKDPLKWDQEGGRNNKMEPSFFNWNFTYAKDGRGPTETQKDNFKLVQTLLQTGESPDRIGLVWRIPGHVS